MSLGTESRNGISLNVMITILKRLKKQYPNGLLRISSAGVWTVRHTKTVRGFESLFVDTVVTDSDIRKIQKARDQEDRFLIVKGGEE